MALNITFFNSLSLFDQRDIVRRHGEYLTTLRETKNIANLYLVDNVFIEVYFYEDCTKVKCVKVINIYDRRMELYVNKVNLTDLYQTNA